MKENRQSISEKKVREWNAMQGKAYQKAEKEYFALREKYLKLNGSASCEYSSFICEVVTCTKTTEKERINDLYTIIRYHEAEGRFGALQDYINN